MTRISILSKEDMSDEQRSVIDASVASGQPNRGPFWAYIRNPKLMRTVHDMNDCLADSTLSRREQLIAILTVARHWGAKFPWAVQVNAAGEIGLDQDIIDAINSRSALSIDDRRESLAHRVAAELLADHGLSDATYEAAEEAFTTDELIILIARIGSFSMTCCTANGFDITPPEDAPARLAE